MKKTRLFSSISLLVLMLIALNINAQEFKDLDKSPMDVAAFPASYKISDKLIKIAYSRPQLKEREVYKLAPLDKVWRTGANEAPELTLYTDMKLGKNIIKKGTYTFLVIPGEDEWTAIISKDLNLWGSYTYNEANDVARFTVPVKKSEESLEAFSIAFEKSDDGVAMHLGWGTYRVAIPFVK